MPTLTWSQGTKEETFEIYQDINHGIWEVESVLTFIPEEIHDTSDLTCTATFHGGRTSSAGVALNVKRKIFFPFLLNFVYALIFQSDKLYLLSRGSFFAKNIFKSLLSGTPSVNHIIIHAAVGASLAVIFGVVCIFMGKKYK